MEVSCSNPGTASFALTEQRHPDSWRWAIFNTDGSILGTGCESTQAQAKQVAEAALRSTVD